MCGFLTFYKTYWNLQEKITKQAQVDKIIEIQLFIIGKPSAEKIMLKSTMDQKVRDHSKHKCTIMVYVYQKSTKNGNTNFNFPKLTKKKLSKNCEKNSKIAAVPQKFVIGSSLRTSMCFLMSVKWTTSN